jgi:hypothetical protein
MAQQLRERIDKWYCMKLKSFCPTTKTRSLNLRGCPQKGKGLCQVYISQGFDNENIQGAQKTKLAKIAQ